METEKVVDTIVNTCASICATLGRMSDQEIQFAKDIQAINDEIRASNRKFKKDVYEAAVKVIFEGINQDISKDMLKDLVQSQISYLFHKEFGQL